MSKASLRIETLQSWKRANGIPKPKKFLNPVEIWNPNVRRSKGFEEQVEPR